MTRTVQLEASWLEVIGDEFNKPYIGELRVFLQQEKQRYVVYPAGSLYFNALNTTPFNQVKVVILGQDPYHGPNQAHGLCFSVQKGVPAPPSLINIFQEIHNSLGISPPDHGDLTNWARQGVLLLNTTLSVRANKPKSHAGKGWEQLTDRIIDELSKRHERLIFVLWGRHARNKAERIDRSKHLILEAPHPSPYSASYGFFGCNHFKLINDDLINQGKTPINWQL